MQWTIKIYKEKTATIFSVIFNTLNSLQQILHSFFLNVHKDLFPKCLIGLGFQTLAGIMHITINLFLLSLLVLIEKIDTDLKLGLTQFCLSIFCYNILK